MDGAPKGIWPHQNFAPTTTWITRKMSLDIKTQNVLCTYCIGSLASTFHSMEANPANQSNNDFNINN